MSNSAYSIPENSGLKLLGKMQTNSRVSMVFISHMVAKFTALPESSKFIVFIKQNYREITSFAVSLDGKVGEIVISPF
jgi:hypothetical protein